MCRLVSNIGGMLLLRKAYRFHSNIGLSQPRDGKKTGQTSSFLPFLRHITQIQIDIIINVSFKYRNVKFYLNKKNQVPLRVRASEATR